MVDDKRPAPIVPGSRPVSTGPIGPQHVRNIPVDLIVTLLTCGLFNLYVQYKQMQAVNDMLGEPKYSWLTWALLTLITCGIYHIYHEWRKSTDVARCQGEEGSSEPVVNIILTVVGLSIVADAIQQAEINRYYGSTSL